MWDSEHLLRTCSTEMRARGGSFAIVVRHIIIQSIGFERV